MPVSKRTRVYLLKEVRYIVVAYFRPKLMISVMLLGATPFKYCDGKQKIIHCLKDIDFNKHTDIGAEERVPFSDSPALRPAIASIQVKISSTSKTCDKSD